MFVSLPYVMNTFWVHSKFAFSFLCQDSMITFRSDFQHSVCCTVLEIFFFTFLQCVQGTSSQFVFVYKYSPNLFLLCCLFQEAVCKQSKNIYTHMYEGIWKVLSMVYYLSNPFTDPIMCGVIIKSYSSSMLWHKFHEDIILQTRKILL